MTDISVARVNALRLFYVVAFVAGVGMYWPRLFRPDHALGIYDGAAFSFWAALMALFGLGIRYPLQMVPLIVLQLSYKVPTRAGASDFDSVLTEQRQHEHSLPTVFFERRELNRRLQQVPEIGPPGSGTAAPLVCPAK